MMTATITSGHPVPVPNTGTRQKHGEIAEHIVAGAKPSGAHVGIAAPVSPQKPEGSGVCE